MLRRRNPPSRPPRPRLKNPRRRHLRPTNPSRTTPGARSRCNHKKLQRSQLPNHLPNHRLNHRPSNPLLPSPKLLRSRHPPGIPLRPHLSLSLRLRSPRFRTLMLKSHRLRSLHHRRNLLPRSRLLNLSLRLRSLRLSRRRRVRRFRARTTGLPRLPNGPPAVSPPSRCPPSSRTRTPLRPRRRSPLRNPWPRRLRILRRWMLRLRLRNRFSSRRRRRCPRVRRLHRPGIPCLRHSIRNGPRPM